MTQPTYYVVRRTMVAENFGVHLLQKYLGNENIKHCATDNLTSFTPELLRELSDQKVFLVGGYLLHDLAKLCAVTPQAITVFLNSSDSDLPVRELPSTTQERIKIIRADFPFGFATHAKAQIQELSKEHVGDCCMQLRDYELAMVDLLDNYLYGYITDEAKNFQYGVYLRPGATDYDKVSSITSLEEVKATQQVGESVRKQKLQAAHQQLTRARPLVWKNRSVMIVLAENYSPGNPPIVETCELLSKNIPSGIGMIARHDLKTQKTLVSCRTTQDSGIDAGSLMSELLGGGGSRVMGGGGVAGLLTLEQLISS